MYGTLPLSGPGNGIFPPAVQGLKITNATAATAFVVGSVVMLDIQQTTGGTTSFAPGHATSGVDDSVFNRCILPTTAGLLAGNPIFVCEQAIAAGGVGKASAMSTACTAKVDGSGTNITKGAALIAVNASDALVITPGTTTGAAIVGYLMAAASVTTATTATIWLNGFGFKTSAT